MLNSRKRSSSESNGSTSHTPDGPDTHAHPVPPATDHSNDGGDGHIPDSGDGHTPKSGDGSAHREDAGTTVDGGGSTSTRTGETTTAASPSSEAGIMRSFTELLEAQKQMMMAQVQAMAAQSFPPLDKFTGEDCHTDEGSFDRWIKRFEERAKIAGWKGEQKLLQLKAHLVKTAEHSFRMMPREKADYDLAIGSLRKRFLLFDIEELRGLEFHQLTQEK